MRVSEGYHRDIGRAFAPQRSEGESLDNALVWGMNAMTEINSTDAHRVRDGSGVEIPGGLAKILHDLALNVGATDNLLMGLRLCLQAAVDASGLDCGGVYLRDESSGGLDIACHTNLSEIFIAAVSHFGPEAPNTQLVAEGCPVYATYSTAGIPTDEITWREGLRALAVIPILNRGRVIACLNMASHSLDDTPVEARFVLETIAHEIGGTLARLRAEEAWRKSRERLVSIFRAAPVGIGVVVNRVITEVNERILDMTGYAREDLIDHSSSVLYPSDEEFDRVGRKKYEEIRRRGSGTVETQWRRKDGDIIDVLLSSSALDPGNLPAGVTFTALDITERNRAEASLRAHREQLRTLVSELVLAEERERHRIATDLHDEVCQSLVLARMKLRPLLQDAPAGSPLGDFDHCIEDILVSVRDLTFDLGSPTLHRFGLEKAMEELLEDQIKLRHGLDCRFITDGRAKPLTGDVSVLLFRSVRELLVNVVKHARAGRVDLDVRRIDDAIRITVTDDGVGTRIDEALASSAHRRHFGLFSIRERLDSIGGRLDADSEPGRGSRFTLVAPLNTSTP
jgi:PAS domain S-box-containing protein